MRVCDSWGHITDYLDAAKGNGEVELAVETSLLLDSVVGLYFVRKRSMRMLWNYVCEIGLRSVVDKILSRQKEKARNQKYVIVGRGRVLAADDPALGPGTPVLFLAPRHPAHADHVVLARPLVARDDGEARSAQAEVRYANRDPAARLPWAEVVAGWDPSSGVPAPILPWADIAAMLDALDWARASTFVRNPVRAKERPATIAYVENSGASLDTFVGTLFGYGNYAKTVIIPSLPRNFRIARIHEIDPLQIPASHDEYTWDTSARPAPNDASGTWFIAGYHHTHAELAVQALDSGRVAVVEKPLVVDARQLAALDAALARGQGRYFACFHKRYSPFNSLAFADLGVNAGTAVSYHCIVYEVPLPPRHWYRWPNSRSRIVSNGCHWLDHFLFLNDFCPPKWARLERGPDDALNVSVALENGAFFTMVLTDRGSGRIGMRDFIELRVGDRSVRIDNSSRYQAESESRILRRARMNKMVGYRMMYRTIGERVAQGAPGDTPTSVRVSSALMLELDALMSEQ